LAGNKIEIKNAVNKLEVPVQAKRSSHTRERAKDWLGKG